jgi:bifunctional UDP-N-acetylglucosamine pyrophosphorylase/glucosamine-1-phosphate N-acetyltransferase
MESNLPKVCHQVLSPHNNKFYPMIVHVILTSLSLNPEKIYIVVGQYKEIIENVITEYLTKEQLSNINWVIQEKPLGTGHAILCGLDQLKTHKKTPTLILSGDVPLISKATLEGLLQSNFNTLLSAELQDPTGSGRLILDDQYQITRIIEQKDCTEEEKHIKLVNCGIYKINSDDLVYLLPQITNKNKSNEYYLTDIVELMNKNNIKIRHYLLASQLQYEIKNVNSQEDLINLNSFIKSL